MRTGGVESRVDAIPQKASPLQVAIVALQLAAVCWLTNTLRILPPTFSRTLLVMSVAFVVHAILPHRHRLPFFGGLSLLAIVLSLGVDAGAAVLSVGAAFIAVCHLPASWRTRIVLVGVGVVGLALLRLSATTSLPATVWAALAAMLMFRLISYLQWLRHATRATDRWEALAYFFMLPSAYFPLFPVIDFPTFLKSRESSSDPEVYERGLSWMVRGLLHLIAYRLIHDVFTVGEVWANDLLDVVQHIGTAFLLYLKVSGQFHVIVGLLHLFGFRLPETHHLYLLATSFSDFWRRINIYWKDFMLKLVYYPVYFRFRHMGPTVGIGVATICVFVTTWALHSYQYFWLQGQLLLSWSDVAFWAVFGVLVVASGIRERSRSAPTLSRTRWSPRRALQVTGTMAVILVLWSLWTSESTGTWLYMWSMTRFASKGDVGVLVILLVLLTAAAGFPWGDQPAMSQRSVSKRVVVLAGVARLALLCGMALLTTPTVLGWIPAGAAKILGDLRFDGLTKRDEFVRMVGYYNELIPKRMLGAAVVDSGSRGPAFDTAAGWVPREDFLLGAIRPSSRTSFLGQAFSTNRYGFRDAEYEIQKPEGTFRIAIIGPSYVMGWGVADNETLDYQLESLLSDLSRTRIEVLNISLPAWSMAQEVFAIKALAARFSPDLVLLSAHPYELVFVAERVLEAKRRAIPIPDLALAALVEQAGVNSASTPLDARLRMRTVEEEWHERVMQWALESSAAADARVAVLAVGLPGPNAESTFRPVLRGAARTGIPVLDCLRVFRGLAFASVALSDTDGHPNGRGQALLAACTAAELRGHGLLPEQLSGTAPSGNAHNTATRQ